MFTEITDAMQASALKKEFKYFAELDVSIVHIAARNGLVLTARDMGEPPCSTKVFQMNDGRAFGMHKPEFDARTLIYNRPGIDTQPVDILKALKILPDEVVAIKDGNDLNEIKQALQWRAVPRFHV